MFTRKVLLWLSCGDFPVYELLAYSQTPLYSSMYSACTVYCTHVTPVSVPVARSLSDRRQRKVTTQHKPRVHLMILPALVSKLDIV